MSYVVVISDGSAIPKQVYGPFDRESTAIEFMETWDEFVQVQGFAYAREIWKPPVQP